MSIDIKYLSSSLISIQFIQLCGFRFFLRICGFRFFLRFRFSEIPSQICSRTTLISSLTRIKHQWLSSCLCRPLFNLLLQLQQLFSSLFLMRLLFFSLPYRISNSDVVNCLRVETLRDQKVQESSKKQKVVFSSRININLYVVEMWQKCRIKLYVVVNLKFNGII